MPLELGRAEEQSRDLVGRDLLLESATSKREFSRADPGIPAIHPAAYSAKFDS